ncbi:MAG: N-acetylglucosamine-specific PTS transporter subunit IIBC [Lachnospiraceae bacterium]
MKLLQRLGKSLMLPVACLPVAAILMGVGYWIDPTGWGANNLIAAFLIKAGSAVIDNMGILFAIGVAVGMSDDGDGTSALAALVSWLIIQNLLSPGTVAIFQGIDVADVAPAFDKIQNQFIGIMCGLIGANCYNRFKSTKLPDALSFFSGKRCVSIVTAGCTLIAALILYFVWPVIYTALVSLGTAIISTGSIGAGIYAFLNRLLIPTGLHHALNSVFWFDIAGIDDIAKFWGTNVNGIYGQTGMYMTGFFPVMMFGMPAAALAMYHTAKPEKKKVTYGLLLSAGFAAFFTGVTEPLEFAFMFLAPGLYLVHALIAGVVATVCAFLPVRSGFNFSGGFIDWLLSFKAPMAQNPLLIIPIGLVVACLYYFIFRFVIIKFNLKTPGREDDDIAVKAVVKAGSDQYVAMAEIILEGLGGKENVMILDNCVTRLRLELRDLALVDDAKIRSAGVSGIIRPGKNSIQVVVGTKVQFVADAMKQML